MKSDKILKAVILRVGIDKGCGGALAPIFSDGSFEYIPIPESDDLSNESRTFANTRGRTGKYFASYLPSKIKNEKMHFDPEFETFTYGDPSTKRNYLLKLGEGDLLVFYAGLTPHENKVYPEALYLMGYFNVEKVVDFNNLSEKELIENSKQYSGNAHLKRRLDLENLVIVVGDKEKSQLLSQAILISQRKPDKRGRPYHAVSEEMEELLGIRGSIQRSIPPRIIEDKEKIHNLKKLLGI
jgi:hypothetical protein